MTTDAATPACAALPALCAVIAVGSKGGEASIEKDGNVPLGNGGRLRPPLFYGHAAA